MKIYTKDDLESVRKRADLLAIIEGIESKGVNIDMSKYPRDTMVYMRQAILEHQEKEPEKVSQSAEVEADEEEGNETTACGRSAAQERKPSRLDDHDRLASDPTGTPADDPARWWTVCHVGSE